MYEMKEIIQSNNKEFIKIQANKFINKDNIGKICIH